MAWTAPRTWSVGETLTAANFNTHIRDNLNAVPHLIARKTADQSVTSSVTLVNDTHISFAVAVNEVWSFDLALYWTAANPGALKMAWTFPASGRVDWSAVWWNQGLTAANIAGASDTTSPGTADTIGVDNASPARNVTHVSGMYVGGGNAGTVQLQWAQGTSSATATTLFTNTALWGVKLA